MWNMMIINGDDDDGEDDERSKLDVSNQNEMMEKKSALNNSFKFYC